MKSIYRILLTLHVCVALIVLWGCTENPFFKEDTIANKTIRGKVELSDQMSPNDVFVWLKDCDVSTRTDENGFFKLALPPPAKQPGGGLNGVFNLYFYVANYQLDFAKVAILNGAVEYSKGDVNEKGELRKTQRLSKLIDVRISINPASISENSQDTVTAFVTVQAVKGTVWATGLFSIPSYKGDAQFMAGFIKKVDSNENFVNTIYNSTKSYGKANFPVSDFPLTLLPMVIYYKPGMLFPGEYEVIPYLLIQQDTTRSTLYDDLMNSLGEDVEDFGPDFLNIPLKVENNRFRVKTGN